jgi:hypothetical protein
MTEQEKFSLILQDAEQGDGSGKLNYKLNKI